jgi:DNA helicase-2/ATP-dependent DNA helicase PcrA
VIDRIIDRSGLRQHYLADKEGQDRLENLDELINAATASCTKRGRCVG